MADQCQNFFNDDRSTQMSLASSSADHRTSPATPASCIEELHNHSLELRLGFASEEKPRQKMLRPVPVYPKLEKQRSENFATAFGNGALFGAQATVPVGDKALFSRTRPGSAFSTPRISRDDVWQTVQKGNAVLGGGMGSSPLTAAASPLWSRRSNSMQVTMPCLDVPEVIAHAIRRSSSNCIPQGLISHHSARDSELFVNEGAADTLLLDSHQHHEALELHRKKKIQAHRRLEARKRRRLQLEEKQQKKALQRQNGKQCISPTEESPQCHQNSKGCVSSTTERSLHVRSPFVDDPNEINTAKPEQEWQSEGAQGEVTVGEDASMPATAASSFSELKTTRSKEDSRGAGSSLVFEPESPSQKSSTGSNSDPAKVSHPVTKPTITVIPGFNMAEQVSSQCHIKKSGAESSGLWRKSSLVGEKSVGVFSEGKWKAIDETFEVSSIRRTASNNINQVVSECPGSLKQRSYQVGAAASQQSFADIAGYKRQESKAGGILRNVKQEPEVPCPDRLLSVEGSTVNCYDSTSQIKKPIPQQPGFIQDTASLATKRKVKEEILELCDGDVGALQANLARIDRQRSCSLPQLPWVSATGRGPNGKMINGVMYISDGFVRLVCRCHGKHMSPSEFVEHSGSTDLSNPLRSIMVSAFGTSSNRVGSDLSLWTM